MAHELKLKQRFVAVDGLRGVLCGDRRRLHLYDFGQIEPPLFIRTHLFLSTSFSCCRASSSRMPTPAH